MRTLRDTLAFNSGDYTGVVDDDALNLTHIINPDVNTSDAPYAGLGGVGVSLYFSNNLGASVLVTLQGPGNVDIDTSIFPTITIPNGEDVQHMIEFPSELFRQVLAIPNYCLKLTTAGNVTGDYVCVITNLFYTYKSSQSPRVVGDLHATSYHLIRNDL